MGAREWAELGHGQGRIKPPITRMYIRRRKQLHIETGMRITNDCHFLN
jgi:hypothetical protein